MPTGILSVLILDPAGAVDLHGEGPVKGPSGTAGTIAGRHVERKGQKVDLDRAAIFFHARSFHDGLARRSMAVRVYAPPVNTVAG